MDNWIYRGGKQEQRNSLGHEGHRGGVKDTHSVDGIMAYSDSGLQGILFSLLDQVMMIMIMMIMIMEGMMMMIRRRTSTL